MWHGLYVFASKFPVATPGGNVALGQSILAPDVPGFPVPPSANLGVRRPRRPGARGKSRMRGAESLHPSRWALYSGELLEQPGARVVG